MLIRPRVIATAMAGAMVLAGALALRPAATPAPFGVAAAAAAPATAPDPGALVPYLRFSGTASVPVTPDRAQIQVSVSFKERTPSIALDRTSQAMRKIVARMEALGARKEDLQTGWVNTYADGKKWRAEQSLTVTVRDVSKIGRFLNQALKAGATSVYGPSMFVSEASAAYQTAVNGAIDNARHKADALAAHLGVGIGGVVSVDDGAGLSGVYGSGAGDAIQVEPGQQEIRATVSVIFSYLS